MNFEATLLELETMVEKMAKGQLSLEDSLKNFEQGIALARECQKTLKEAEQKVEILVGQNDSFQTAPFGEDE
jgi:exodeoxyribonuclease VII small subunit